MLRSPQSLRLRDERTECPLWRGYGRWRTAGKSVVVEANRIADLGAPARGRYHAVANVTTRRRSLDLLDGAVLLAPPQFIAIAARQVRLGSAPTSTSPT
jgi:hypothetical protein